MGIDELGSLFLRNAGSAKEGWGEGAILRRVLCGNHARYLTAMMTSGANPVAYLSSLKGSVGF